MKTQSEIGARLYDVLTTPQLNYPKANIVTNTPLALVQLELETERDTLLWVLSTTEQPSAPLAASDDKAPRPGSQP